MAHSEATLAWNRWRARRRWRRRLGSWVGSTAVAALAVALAAWGGLEVFDVGEQGEAVAVKLGNPDGEDLPLSVSAVPDQAMQAIMTAQREVVQTEETRPAAPEPPAAQPAPAPSQATPPSKPTPTPPTPAAPPTPKPTPVPAEKPVTERVIRGSEKGNSSELILKPQGEKIGRNVYTPVYLFMPLPRQVDSRLLAQVKSTALYSADERRSALLQFYTQTSDGLVLNGQPDLPLRPLVWDILEGAGYDVANADYKRERPLKPVVVAFRIGVPATPTSNPELLEVRLDQSSGNPAVDQAVIYAFQRSSYANGTGQVAQGRYTYDFSVRK